MTTPIPPKLLAEVDQRRAELVTLIAAVREHHRIDCAYPHTCPGDLAALAVCFLAHPKLVDLLLVAVVELAALGYGQTPTALLGLDPDG